MNVFMGMLVCVFTCYCVIMCVLVVSVVRVRMAMSVSVAVRMCRLRPMRMLRVRVVVSGFSPVGMRMTFIAGMCVVRSGAVHRHHVHFGSCDAPAAYLAHLEPRAYVQRRSSMGKRIERDAGVHKCAQQHVAADAGKAF